jgi:hypothetical protein
MAISTLVLNIAPVSFSAATFRAGFLPFNDDESYEALREKHRATHVFRFDTRTGLIANIALDDGTPLGEVDEVKVEDHLLLLGKAVQHSISEWLRPTAEVLKLARPIKFFGKASRSRLLKSAATELGVSVDPRIDVVVRYHLDTRILTHPDSKTPPYLGLVLDVNTSNVLDLSVEELLVAGVDVSGKYVSRIVRSDENGLRPRPEILGAVSHIEGDQIALGDTDGVPFVSIHDAALEPRQENLEAVLRTMYPAHATRLLARIRELRSPYNSANGKRQHLCTTLDRIRTLHDFRIGAGLKANVGELLRRNDAPFPSAITTTRPTIFVGPQGRNNSEYPDRGVREFGPYKYMHNERNEPVIVVLCERQHRGRVEQFAESLRTGFPDREWEDAVRGDKKPRENPFRGGLLSKFRLSRVTFEFEEVTGTSADDYRRAVTKVLERLPATPHLALVQTRRDFASLAGRLNPYFVAKAAFMSGGVPVQSIFIETIESPPVTLAHVLNNVAVACYAKLNGIPWVLSTRAPSSHELVIGMGYAEAAASRLAERMRFVGLTTLFQGDGRYIVWGLTREVEFAEYADALLESLRTTINHIRTVNSWQGGDQVRLIFHVYKPLKHREIDSVKALVKEMLADEYRVEYAFVDLSHYHAYQLFDPESEGKLYRGDDGRWRRKGVGVPARGICLQLGPRTALLTLTGASDLKTQEQGMPRPLLIEVHESSDFADLSYLARQIYHFTYMSWRSFFPGTEPVTIAYSRLIARALGNLKGVDGWNSSVLTVGQLRDSKWFL